MERNEFPEVQVLRVQPGDVLLFSTPHSLTMEEYDRIAEDLTKLRDSLGVENVRVVILDSGLNLTVARTPIPAL